MACSPGFSLTIPGPLWGVGFKPCHMFWGQKSHILPLLSWSEQAGEWSFVQMLYTDQAGPREVNLGWTRPCQFLCTLYPPGHAPGKVKQGPLPAIPTATIVPQTPQICAAK